MLNTFYHSTCSSNRESILENGIYYTPVKDPFEVDDKELDWLGMGIYLWDDYSYAVQWNYYKARKKNNTTTEYILNNYDIYNVEVRCNEENYLNIGSNYGLYIFNNLKNHVKSLMEQDNYNHKIKYDKYSKKFWLSFFDILNLWEENDIYMISGNFAKPHEINVKYSELIEPTERQISVKNNCIITNISLNNNQQLIINCIKYYVERKKRYYGFRKNDQYTYKKL